MSQSQAVGIYANTVAGSFPLGEGVDPIDTVQMLAQEVLHAQNVHIIHSILDEHVFYIATNSRSLASSPKFTTSLAAGLPGRPGHQGDGCYYLPLPPNSAVALVRRGNTLKLFTNYAEIVLDSCTAEELPRIDVSEMPAEPMSTQHWVYRLLSNRIASVASMASLGVAAICIFLIIVSNAVSGYMLKSRHINFAETVRNTNAVLESTPLVQPMAAQLSRIQSLTYSVVSAGGWIDGYHYRPATGERYVISLPSWVTGEAIRYIGEGVTTEVQPGGGNLIWVLKKDSAGQSIKNVGPVPIQLAPALPGAVSSTEVTKPATK